MRMPLLCWCAWFLGAVPLAAQRAPFTVGTVTARPGARASGYLDVAAGADTGTRIPITVIHGAAPGPVLALIAGTHGSEVAPILALHRVRRDLDPAALRGTVLLVHIANVPSFARRTIYYSPIDGKNLNRVYPGKADGTVSERIAHTLTTEVIARADYLVDMHAGDGNEDLVPYNYWNRLGLDARADSIGREMALAWGNRGIVIDTARPRDPAASVYTQNTAHLRGKPAITTEGGSLGLPVPEMIQRNYDGAFRLLRHFRMLDGTPERTVHAVWYAHTEVLRSPATGVWLPQVRPGEYVTAGTLVGTVTDYFGDPVAEIRAPFTGVILYVVVTPAMNDGEPVGMVAVPQDDWRD
ncbi:MAG: succinylglutamate desuccinylase/aspartoacylase family protein [Gemmatimonadota bacterium]|nr:succinylglutamate desuccinylase/aspartoacylase family protein [Gemmatimonadota bacterium]